MIRSAFFGSMLSFLAMLSPIHGAMVLWDADFQNESTSGIRPNAALGYSVIDDPAGGGSKVLRVEDLHSTTEYMELRSNQNSSGEFLLNPLTDLKVGATVTMKFDVYLPNNTSAEGLLALLRMRSSSGASYRDVSLSPSLNGIPTDKKDQWLRNLTITMVVPETYLSGGVDYTTYSITPIIAFRDTTPGTGAVGGSTGLAGYFDNISVMVTPEPSQALLMLGGVLALGLRRRRH